MLEKNPKWQDLADQVSEAGRKVMGEAAEALAQGKAFTAYVKMQELEKEIKLNDAEKPNQLVAQSPDLEQQRNLTALALATVITLGIIIKAKQIEDNNKRGVISINRNQLEQLSRSQLEQIAKGAVIVATGCAATIFVMKALKEWFDRDSDFRNSGESCIASIGRNQAIEFSIPEGFNTEEKEVFLKACQWLKGAFPNANLKKIEQEVYMVIIVNRMVNSVVSVLDNRSSLAPRVSLKAMSL